MIKGSNRKWAGILPVVGILCLVSAIALAADANFAGTWKGEYSASAPAATTPAPGGGNRGGGGGFGGPQKITLRVKVNKEKASGNFTIGSSSPEDIREGKIVDNKLTFKTGLAPAPIYDYEAAINGDDLSVTRTPEGGKGGRPQMFTLTRGK
jgi:hypothetical protein